MTAIVEQAAKAATAGAIAPRRSAVADLDVIMWSLTAAVGALVALAVAAGGFHPAWHSFAGPGVAFTLLLGGAWFYSSMRHDPKLASALTGTAQVIAFSTLGAPLSYVATAAAWSFPLQDHLLDAVDKAFGLDWRAVLTWMDAHAGWHVVLRAAYGSFTLQAALVILALAFTGRMIWLRIFVLSFAIAALIAIATAAVFPAYGVWGFYGLTPLDHPHIDPVVRDLPVPIINGLRDGTYRTLLGIGAEGIITFPSLHAAFAVILAAAFWPLPVLRWVGLAINVLMLAATLVDGAHYFVDIFSGLMVAAIALAAAQALAARAVRQRGLPAQWHSAAQPLQ